MAIASDVVYSGHAPNRVPQIITKPIKYMKTNTLQITLTGIAASSLALFAVTTIAVAVSYAAAAMLIAVAAVDYRQGPRSYVAR